MMHLSQHEFLGLVCEEGCWVLEHDQLIIGGHGVHCTIKCSLNYKLV